MSRARPALMFESAPGKWYFFLYNGRYSDPDEWLEDPDTDVVGPFDTEEQAWEYIHQRWSNPGGGELLEHGRYSEKRGKELRDVIARRGKKPEPRFARSFPRYNPRKTKLRVSHEDRYAVEDPYSDDVVSWHFTVREAMGAARKLSARTGEPILVIDHRLSRYTRAYSRTKRPSWKRVR